MKDYATRTRILITGGAGFLCSHLCERLLAAGHDVICLDYPDFELMHHDDATFPLTIDSPASRRWLPAGKLTQNDG